LTKVRVAVIAGDGIGKEVIPAGMHVVGMAASRHGLEIAWTEFPWGCDFYHAHRRMMDSDALEQLRHFDAIYLGAIGDPSVPDHISVWELILPIRQHFEQYVNLRPMRLLESVTTPLARRGPADIDMICVRENSEGEYIGAGTRTSDRAEQTGIFTRRGIERIARYGFGVARKRSRRLLASATKSNALQHSMVLWDQVVEEVSADFPDVNWRKYHVDALAARMVSDPGSLDVILASNLFGDILTDLGSAVSGSLGIAPGANLNPERDFPSMFEPIHGSAPDIAGRGIANPIGTIWAGALMLDHLGATTAHDAIVHAIERVLAGNGPRTPDLGGTATTREVTDAIGEHL
jgi:tartrate dehydrogenase/decarboxylase/D-malate dehydrogenase